MTTPMVRYCLRCDSDVAVDPDTWACEHCGKPTGFAPALNGAVPPTRQAIDSLADHLTATANAKTTDALRLMAEAERLRQAAGVIRAAVIITDVPRVYPKEDPHSRPQKPAGRWAKDYDACQGCGRTSQAHASKGLCGTCTARVRLGRDIAPPVREWRLEGRWSRKYEACTNCEQTDRPHVGRGLCAVCYQRKQIGIDMARPRKAHAPRRPVSQTHHEAQIAPETH
jgi:hypothetical protein